MADRKHLAIRQSQAAEDIARRLEAIESVLTAPSVDVISELIAEPAEPLASAEQLSAVSIQIAALDAKIDAIAAQLALIIAAPSAPTEPAPSAESTKKK